MEMGQEEGQSNAPWLFPLQVILVQALIVQEFRTRLCIISCDIPQNMWGSSCRKNFCL
jgi:hypothetical protein